VRLGAQGTGWTQAELGPRREGRLGHTRGSSGFSYLLPFNFSVSLGVTGLGIRVKDRNGSGGRYGEEKPGTGLSLGFLRTRWKKPVTFLLL
jgi:hypothetical protein